MTEITLAMVSLAALFIAVCTWLFSLAWEPGMFHGEHAVATVSIEIGGPLN